ncbi:DoxX family protein [Leeuwenhoekiella sp. NPDC079379]|uniref:DoxX family protein n=1 Tax=Leeuwenhoekiella sp. NPDC079379 TaxID=3364122 RepID=UPI0037CB957E
MVNQKNKALNIILWIAQGLLAAMFIMAGMMKISQPVEVLADSLPWVTSTPLSLVRFIGFTEILGGLGLVLPAVFKLKPALTIWAAMGLALVMVFAAIFHASRGEFTAIGMNIFLMGIALFIIWGRRKKSSVLVKN